MLLGNMLSVGRMLPVGSKLPVGSTAACVAEPTGMGQTGVHEVKHNRLTAR